MNAVFDMALDTWLTDRPRNRLASSCRLVVRGAYTVLLSTRLIESSYLTHYVLVYDSSAVVPSNHILSAFRYRSKSNS